MTTSPGDAAAERGRLARAVKATDSTFTTFLVTPYSKRIARWAAGYGVAPTTVTVGSIVLGLVAAVLFGVGDRVALVAGAVVLQLAFVADCVDGQLARYSGRTSAFGAWLDAIGDRFKEYAVYAGLAVGSVRQFDDHIWQLALAALALQMFRHTVDFGFAARPLPKGGPDSDNSRVASVGYWFKRSLVLPIGERFAVISVMAAFFTPSVTFVVLLGWGALCRRLRIGRKDPPNGAGSGHRRRFDPVERLPR